jgi:hypothetical protein
MKKYYRILSLSVALVLVFLVIINLSASVNAASVKLNVEQTIKSMEKAEAKKSWGPAANYSKKIALYYDEKEQYDLAAKYYDLTAKYWTNYGEPSWGIVNTIRADHIRTEVNLLVEAPATKKSLGKFEPLGGVYAGLYPAGSAEKGNPLESLINFEQKHAIYLTYAHWRKTYESEKSVFPLPYANKVKEAGGAIQVAWEPSFGLDDVKDDEYVRQFAREARELGIPVFLRFAGEMNGEWVPWFDTPERYIEKFRLIHDIMAEDAPNVAMVWSPNFLPRHNIDSYYPGDAYVDWVGFSLYTIPYSQGVLKLGGNPIDYLKPLYDVYSHKPIIISEGAISFYSYELGEDFTDWATHQLHNMYAYLPRLLPNVKAITYFNLDKQTTTYDNQNNNYDLNARESMLKIYNKLIKAPLYVDTVTDGGKQTNPIVYKPIAEAKELKGVQKLSTYVKLPLGEVPYAVHLYDGDGKLLVRSYKAPFDVKIDFAKLPKSGKLIIKVLNSKFNVLHTQQFSYN